MPLYDYFCKQCGKPFDAFRSVEQRGFAECPKCAGLSMMVFNPKNSKVVFSRFEPYWDDHIADDPVYLETKRQKERILKSKGLVEAGNDMEWK